MTAGGSINFLKQGPTKKSPGFPTGHSDPGTLGLGHVPPSNFQQQIFLPHFEAAQNLQQPTLSVYLFSVALKTCEIGNDRRSFYHAQKALKSFLFSFVAPPGPPGSL